jgi:hypothetical protein
MTYNLILSFIVVSLTLRGDPISSKFLKDTYRGRSWIPEEHIRTKQTYKYCLAMEAPSLKHFIRLLPFGLFHVLAGGAKKSMGQEL